MERYELPDGWRWSTIGEEYQVNQRDPKLRELQPDLPVSFVPMAAVDAERGVIATPEAKSLSEVRKGFTPFRDNDVIFARITPSMENGKAAIARELINGLGFGSTEFHVMRPTNGNLPEWVFYFIRQRTFRDEAKANFTGTAGQLRVPDKFLRNAPIPIPPNPEQHRIVNRIESLLAEARTARAALDRAEPLLKKFRQAVLAAAFRGELTERDAKDEPASASNYIKTESPRQTELPQLPSGWLWVRFEDLLVELKNGYFSKRPEFEPPGIPILRVSSVRPFQVNLSELRYLREDMSRVAQYQLRDRDLLFTRYNGTLELVGVCGMVRGLSSPTLHPDKLIRARVIEDILPEYLELYFASSVPRAIIEDKAKSSAGQQGISGKDLKNVPVIVAPFTEQQHIVERIEALFTQAEQIGRAVKIARRRTEKVEQAILARAFRGEL